jgi:uncharacterized membrane protein
MHTQANEAHYLSLVWGIALTTAICSYFLLQGSMLCFGSLLILLILCVAFFSYAGVKRRKVKKFAYSRSNTTILADLILESLRVSIFSLMLDVSVQGATYKFLTNDQKDAWGNVRLGSLVLVMIGGYLYSIFFAYPIAAKEERATIAANMKWQETDV